MTPDDQILAAELALDVLDGDERQAAVARVAADPAFAQEVDWWRTQLGGLLAEYGEAAPHDLVGARIAQTLEQRHPPVVAPRRVRWPWFAGGAAVGALAASLAALLLTPTPTVLPPAPSTRPVSRPALLAAAVAPAAGTTGAALPVVVDPAGQFLRVAIPPTIPAEHAAELWRIGADGVPRSLGILRATGATQLRVTVSLHPGDTLAISIEPPGGSPKAGPTGPVVATGKLVTT